MEVDLTCNANSSSLVPEGPRSRGVCWGAMRCAGNNSTPPQTPQKKQSYNLDYSTPRRRYGINVLPETPDPTPTKKLKRTAVNPLEELSPCSPLTKRRHTDPQTPTPRSLIRRESIPKFSVLCRPKASDSTALSADELRRTCEAVLAQVDWRNVQEYVASNRSKSAYRTAVLGVLQAEVNKLFREEDQENREDPKDPAIAQTDRDPIVGST